MPIRVKSRKLLKQGACNPENFRSHLSQALQNDGFNASTIETATLALLGALTVPQHKHHTAPEMGWYQPVPIGQLLDLFEKVPFTEEDHLVDLGSGLGVVSLLFTSLTPGQSTAVEISKPLHDLAFANSVALQAPRISFINGDVTDQDLSKGNKFFLFNSFSGEILEECLKQLHTIANTKQIEIFATGTVNIALRNTTWLEPIDDTFTTDDIMRFLSHRIDS